MDIDALYNYTLINCKNDTACPGSSLCFFFNKTNPALGVCSCNAELGDTGDLCNELSTYSYVRLSTMISLSFISVLILIYIFYEILVLDHSKIKRFDVKVTSLIECILALLFLIIYKSIGIFWVFSPDLAAIDESTGKKKRPLSIVRNIGLSGFAFFLIAATLNVSTLWLEVAIASKKFKKINNPQLSKKYQFAVSIFDAFVVISNALINWFYAPITPIFGILVFSMVASM